MIATGKPARHRRGQGDEADRSSDELAPIVDQVLAANADMVGRYKGGNMNVFGAIAGMVMKQTKGQGNPKLIAELVNSTLD